MNNHNYFIYIVTNPRKTTLYLGVTNNLERRLKEHYENRGKPKTFAGRYYCFKLMYYERFDYIDKAIEREKELKKWSRKKKNALIETISPYWNELNQQIWEF